MRGSWLLLLAAGCGPGDVLVGRDTAESGGAGAQAGGSGGAGGGSGEAGQGGAAGGSGGAGGAAGVAGGGGAGPGTCGTPGEEVTCGVTEFCDHEDKACGRVALQGTCKPRPQLAVCPEECNPICACDGVVYCNECHANNAGVDADPDGSCP